MLVLHKPTEAQLSNFLEEQSKLAVRYSNVGMSRIGESNRGNYRKHVAEIVLGSGENTFQEAVENMKKWRNFTMDWILLFPSKPDLAPNTTLVVSANHWLLWSVNACRIVYVIDELTESKKRFGFGYGTLPGHVEQGEERFLIEWDTISNYVTYEIIAYSRPNHPLVAAVWPLAGVIQDHFRKESLLSLKNSLSG